MLAVACKIYKATSQNNITTASSSFQGAKLQTINSQNINTHTKIAQQSTQQQSQKQAQVISSQQQQKTKNVIFTQSRQIILALEKTRQANSQQNNLSNNDNGSSTHASSSSLTNTNNYNSNANQNGTTQTSGGHTKIVAQNQMAIQIVQTNKSKVDSKSLGQNARENEDIQINEKIQSIQKQQQSFIEHQRSQHPQKISQKLTISLNDNQKFQTQNSNNLNIVKPQQTPKQQTKSQIPSLQDKGSAIAEGTSDSTNKAQLSSITQKIKMKQSTSNIQQTQQPRTSPVKQNSRQDKDLNQKNIQIPSPTKRNLLKKAISPEATTKYLEKTDTTPKIEFYIDDENLDSRYQDHTSQMRFNASLLQNAMNDLAEIQKQQKADKIIKASISNFNVSNNTQRQLETITQSEFNVSQRVEKPPQTPKTMTPNIMISKQQPLIQNNFKNQQQKVRAQENQSKSPMGYQNIDTNEDQKIEEPFMSEDQDSMISKSSTKSLKAQQLLEELHNQKRMSALGTQSYSNYYMKENLGDDRAPSVQIQGKININKQYYANSGTGLDSGSVRVEMANDYMSSGGQNKISNNYYKNESTTKSQKSNDCYQYTPGGGDNNSSRQRVRVRIGPNGKRSMESSTSETPNSVLRQEIIARAKVNIKSKLIEHQQKMQTQAQVENISPLSFAKPYSKQEYASPDLIPSQEFQQQKNQNTVQQIHISKNPSTKFMNQKNQNDLKTSENMNDMSSIQPFNPDSTEEQTQDQTYTSLLLQNPSTKLLLEKLTEKQKQLYSKAQEQEPSSNKASQKLESQKIISNELNNPKQFTLPKKQQKKAIKIDLGDSPDIHQIQDVIISNQEDYDGQAQTVKPTTLSCIGNKTIVMNNKQQNQNSGRDLLQIRPVLNLDRDLSNADDDELRLSNVPSRKPSEKQIQSVLMGCSVTSKSQHHQQNIFNPQSFKNQQTSNLNRDYEQSLYEDKFNRDKSPILEIGMGVDPDAYINSLCVDKQDAMKRQKYNQSLAQQAQRYNDEFSDDSKSRKSLIKNNQRQKIIINIQNTNEDEDFSLFNQYEQDKQCQSPSNAPLRLEDLHHQNRPSTQMQNNDHDHEQSIIAQIQIEKVNEEYCLQQTQMNGHSKKNTLFCQSAIVNDVVRNNNNQPNPLSADSPYQMNQSTTPNAQQFKKKPLVRRFKYKNLTENQTPSSKSFLTDQKNSIDTPQSNNTSVCGSQISNNHALTSRDQFQGNTAHLTLSLPFQQTRADEDLNIQKTQEDNQNCDSEVPGTIHQLYAPTFINQDCSDQSAEPSGHLLRNNSFKFHTQNALNQNHLQQIPQIRQPQEHLPPLHSSNTNSKPSHLHQQHKQQSFNFTPSQIQSKSLKFNNSNANTNINNSNNQYYFNNNNSNSNNINDTNSTNSQQDIQNRIMEIKQKLLTKTQVFSRVDENKRIVLPMRKNNSQNCEINSLMSQDINDIKRQKDNTLSVQNRDGAFCSAEISDICSVQTTSQLNYPQDDKAAAVKINNKFHNQDMHRKLTHQQDTLQIQIDDDINSIYTAQHQPSMKINIDQKLSNKNLNPAQSQQQVNKEFQDIKVQEMDENLLDDINDNKFGFHRESMSHQNSKVALNQESIKKISPVKLKPKSDINLTELINNNFRELQEIRQSQKIDDQIVQIVVTGEQDKEGNQVVETEGPGETDDNNIIEEEEQMAATLPTIKGTVYKKIDNPRKVKNGKSYKKRYGLVRNKKFKYYKDKEMKELSGVFDFDRIQCVIMIDDGSTSNYQSMRSSQQDHPLKTEDSDSPSGKGSSVSNRYIEPKKFRIEVIGTQRNFVFHVQSSSALRQWTQALYANWHASQSFTLQNPLKMLNNPFWKSDVIPLTTFRKLADTGDIILFTGSSFVTRVQRAITMSDYDHVAMLLRYSNGKLVMFESTGQTGVAVLDWDLFVKNNWQKLYTKLCYRKLRHNRTLETMQKLETFIRTVIGMKYKLNPTKILRKKYEKDSENIEDGEDKSYFCSELVASAYKCIGLLPKEVSASQYWPGNFSQKSGLKLMGESMLEDEQTILFDE